jgi:hypothetical protein
MGTSSSSKGPGSGVPIVPPWVDPPQDGAPPFPPPELAPPGRFRPARTALGRFGGSGSQRDLRRGLGHYSRSGMGGAATAARRMAGSSRAAGVLYQGLQALAEGEPLPAQFGIDQAALQGKSQREIADMLVDAIQPVDGTLDAEAARDSAARALAEAIDAGADLTALEPEQIEAIIQSFLGDEVAHRVELDVGAAILDKAPSAADGVRRLEQLRSYVREVMTQRYAAERALRGGRLDRATVERISAEAIRDAFEVFESYL